MLGNFGLDILGRLFRRRERVEPPPPLEDEYHEVDEWELDEWGEDDEPEAEPARHPPGIVLAAAVILMGSIDAGDCGGEPPE